MRSYTHAKIRTGLQYRETIRAGEYAWPGGYQLALLASDCEALCFDCGKTEARQIIRAIRDKSNCGWRVIGSFINYEDDTLHCCNCNKRIPAAYGSDDE